MVIECKTRKIVDAFENVCSQVCFSDYDRKYLRDVGTLTVAILESNFQLSSAYTYYDEHPSRPRLVVEHNFEKDGIFYMQSTTFYEEDFKHFIGDIRKDAQYLAKIIHQELEHKQYKLNVADDGESSDSEEEFEDSRRFIRSGIPII